MHCIKKSGSVSGWRLCVVCMMLCLGWLCDAPASAQRVEFFQTGEEFVGPFASWKNVKTDYGAKGDGAADDTAAIQKALDELRNMPGNSWSTLYFPKGIYRITSTLKTARKQHHDWLGCQIIGEDPANTVIRWDGKAGEWMWGLDAWYCKVSRLAFDGRCKAGVGLMRWNDFSTFCELSDLWFTDIPGIGICLGSNTNNHEGQAEHAVERCRFARCGTGILTADWNTLDIYVWHCLFEECGKGIYNNMGGYQAFGNLFLRSKVCDIGSSNNMIFNIVGNTSVGSKCFIGPFAARGHAQRNRVYDTVDAVAMPALDSMIGNVVRSREGNDGPCIGASGGNHFLAANTFTVPNPIAAGGGRTRNIGQSIVPRNAIEVPKMLKLPGPPENRHRKIFDVRPGTGDDAAELQRQVDAAAAEPGGSNPVVHLRKGTYSLGRTVTLPANMPMQIVGDGASEHGTVIEWKGSGAGPGLKLRGPSRATLLDLSFSFVGSGADALEVDQADQAGGRVYCDQIVCSGNDASRRCDICVLIDGVENSDVTFLNGGWGEFKRGGVVVRGGPALSSGKAASGQVSLLLGALGNNESKLIDVQNGGRVVACGYRDETPKPGSLIDLGPQSSGAVSIVGMSWAATPSRTTPFINLDSFKGTLAYVGNSIGSGYGENDGSFFIRIAGDGSATRLLSAADEFGSVNSITLPKVWNDVSNPKANAILDNCIGGGVNQKKYDLPDVVSGSADKAAEEKMELEMLKQIRDLRLEPPTARPPGVTDVKLLRILIRAAEGRTGVALRR